MKTTLRDIGVLLLLVTALFNIAGQLMEGSAWIRFPRPGHRVFRDAEPSAFWYHILGETAVAIVLIAYLVMMRRKTNDKVGRIPA